MTIKDIARESGYAVGTVSRVLNNNPRVSEDARRKILAVVAQHGYQPNANAKHLKQQANDGIALIVKGTQNMLFAGILEPLQQIIEELSILMEQQFREQFKVISENFSEVFREMFGGGRAQLRLTDAAHVLESPIEIVAQPPGKNLQNMQLLSGGERALTAIAILFSILKMKPSPFCILDEIEAALDDANVSRYAQYLKKLQRKRSLLSSPTERARWSMQMCFMA